MPKISDTSLSGETEVTLRPGGSGRHPHLPDLSTGTRVGRYVVLEKVGAGAMGAVYAAYDPDLDRRVAVKLLHVEHSADARATEAKARMVREAQALARLSHPNVITVHDVGTLGDGDIFIAMELIRGQTLREWAETPRSWQEVLHVYRQAGAGLAYVHRAGLVHRDFKPENVMLADDGRVLVMDFGLARHNLSLESIPDRTDPEISSSGDALSVDLTRTGAVIGTPAYMAPELQLNESADARSDQFSFCVALYAALYGERPFAGDTLPVLSFQVMSGKIRPPPKGSRVPTWVRRIVVRGLDKKPDQRWPDMAALLDSLGRDPAAARRRLGLAALALAVPVALYAGTQLAAGPSTECTDGAARLAGAWDDEVSREIEEAFGATHTAYAQNAAARTVLLLEAYAAGWSEAYRENCEAAAHGEQTPQNTELRARCLDERREELAALTETLVDADAKVVERAVSAVTRLEPISTCGDVAALAAQAPQETDPDLVRQLDTLRGELTRARTLLRAGRPDRAQTIAAEVELTAKELGHAPTRSRALLVLGESDADLGDLEQAAQRLELAYQEAIAGGDDRAALEAATHLVILEGDQRERLEDAQPWIDSALAWLRRGEPSDDEFAELHGAIGNALYLGGKFDEARPHFEEVLELRRRTVEADDPRLAAAENGLGGMWLSLGDAAAALPHLEKALEINEAAFGPQHPEVALGHNNVGVALQFLGRFDEALRHLDTALSIRKATLPEGHPKIASTALNMSFILFEEDRYAEARPYAEEALAGFEKTLGADHPHTARALSNFGGVLHGLGEDEAAIEALLDAKQRLEEALGPDHPDLANVQYDLAEIHLDMGAPDLAVPAARESMRIQEAAPGPPVFLAEAQFLLGRALLAQTPSSAEGRSLVEAAREAATQQGEQTLLDDIKRWQAEHQAAG